MSFLKNFKRRFDTQLDGYLQTKQAQAARLLEDPDLIAMVDHTTQIVRQGGKRLRPYLIDLSYRMAGGLDQVMIERALLAMELFHTYCLIHDDVLDRANERHGLATVDTFVRQQLTGSNRIGARDWASTSQAILAGDLLASWADEAINQLKTDTSAHQAALAVFFTMQTEVICGQMVDIDLTTQRLVTEAMIDKKIWLKTASYSFVGPMKIGVALGGKPLADWEVFIRPLAGALGRAFQIQDDLREVYVEHDFRDITERQPTSLTAHVRTHGSPAEQAELDRLFGQPISRADGDHLANLFERSGAATAARAGVTKYLKAASQTLTKQAMDESLKTEWWELIELIRSFA